MRGFLLEELNSLGLGENQYFTQEMWLLFLSKNTILLGLFHEMKRTRNTKQIPVSLEGG